MEYKNKIINEKRDLKLQQRKETKRAKQLAKKELESDINENIVDVNKTSDRIKNVSGSSSPISLSLSPHATAGASTTDEATTNEPGEALRHEFKSQHRKQRSV